MSREKALARKNVGTCALIVILAFFFGRLCTAQKADDNELHFASPQSSQLQGLVDLDLKAPVDTTSVTLFLDATRLSELSNEYAVETKTAPIWHTVLDTSYFSNGAHTLRAVAITSRGETQASMTVDLHNAPESN